MLKNLCSRLLNRPLKRAQSTLLGRRTVSTRLLLAGILNDLFVGRRREPIAETPALALSAIVVRFHLDQRSSV